MAGMPKRKALGTTKAPKAYKHMDDKPKTTGFAYRQQQMMERDRAAAKFDDGTTSELCAVMKMVKDANPMLEDIRQPMEGPHVKEKRETIAKETRHYRDGTTYKSGVGHVKVDREQRRQGYHELKPYLTLELRLLDGAVLERKSSGVPEDYFGLILAFGAAFPWHRQEVVPEWDDGTAIHPQRATAFDHGSRVVFREFAPPGADLLTTQLQRAGAGFESETHQLALMTLPMTIVAEERIEKGTGGGSEGDEGSGEEDEDDFDESFL